jgi:hypothetical protein
MVKKRNDYAGVTEGETVVTTVDNDDPVSARLAKLEAKVALIMAHLDPSGTSTVLKVKDESEVT